MGLALPADHLHFPDGSHRWYAPVDVDQASWEETMRAHKEQALKAGGCSTKRGARLPDRRRANQGKVPLRKVG